jgi:ACR3 family arsenite efflux pump ArsB
MGSTNKWIVATLIVTFMLQAGLGAPPGSLRRVSSAAITRGLVLMFVIGPAIAFVVVRAIAPPRPVSAALVVLSTVGALPLAARGVRARGGSEGTALVLTYILALMAAFVAVPLSRFLLATRANAELAPGHILLQLIALQVLPLLAGAFIARKSSRAPEIAAVIAKLNLLVLLVAIVVIVAPKVGGLVALGIGGIVASVVFALLMGAMAFAVGGPSTEERCAIVGVSNKPNAGLALAILASAGAPPIYAEAAVGAFLVRVLIGLGIDRLVAIRARQRQRERERLAEELR